MPLLRLLVDMNLSPLTVAILRGHAWDIIRVSDLVPATTPDSRLINLAAEQGY